MKVILTPEGVSADPGVAGIVWGTCGHLVARSQCRHATTDRSGWRYAEACNGAVGTPSTSPDIGHKDSGTRVHKGRLELAVGRMDALDIIDPKAPGKAANTANHVSEDDGILGLGPIGARARGRCGGIDHPGIDGRSVENATIIVELKVVVDVVGGVHEVENHLEMVDGR